MWKIWMPLPRTMAIVPVLMGGPKELLPEQMWHFSCRTLGHWKCIFSEGRGKLLSAHSNVGRKNVTTCLLFRLAIHPLWHGAQFQEEKRKAWLRWWAYFIVRTLSWQQGHVWLEEHCDSLRPIPPLSLQDGGLNQEPSHWATFPAFLNFLFGNRFC